MAKKATDKKTDKKAIKDAKAVVATAKKATSTKKVTIRKTTAKAFSTGKTFSVWGTEQGPKGYGVQIGSFLDADEASEIGKEAIGLGLKQMYIQCGWANNKKVYRLIYGAYKSSTDAKTAITKAATKGFKGGFVKRHF